MILDDKKHYFVAVSSQESYDFITRYERYLVNVTTSEEKWVEKKKDLVNNVPTYFRITNDGTHISYSHEEKCYTNLGLIRKDCYQAIREEDEIDVSLWREVSQKFSFNTELKDYIKEKNEMNKILEIYRDRKIKEIEQQVDYKCEQIKMENKQYAELKTLKKKYNKNEYAINFEGFDFEEKEINAMVEAQKQGSIKQRELFELLEEVEAQLSMCETYEQKQNILKSYKIITNEGKINA